MVLPAPGSRQGLCRCGEVAFVIRSPADLQLGAGPTLVGAAESRGLAVDWLTQSLGEIIREWKAAQQNEAMRQAGAKSFSGLFTLRTPHTSLSIGRKDYSAGAHPDNRAAAAALAATLGVDATELESVNRMDVPWNNNVVLIGGPTSTPGTQVAFEFESQSPGNRHLHRPEDRGERPIIPLVYYGISDEDLVPEWIGWRLEGVGSVRAPNWPYVCTDPKRKWRRLRPTPGAVTVSGVREDPTGKYQVPSDEYLLVTRLANFCSPDFTMFSKYDRSIWPHLIVFSGNHGLATRGLDLLTSADSIQILTELKAMLKGIQDYQIVFRLSEIDLVERDASTYHAPRAIEIFDFAELDIGAKTYRRAHRYAMKRLATFHEHGSEAGST